MYVPQEDEAEENACTRLRESLAKKYLHGTHPPTLGCQINQRGYLFGGYVVLRAD